MRYKKVTLLLCSVETLEVCACVVKTITALGEKTTKQLKDLYVNHHDPEIY